MRAALETGRELEFYSAAVIRSHGANFAVFFAKRNRWPRPRLKIGAARGSLREVRVFTQRADLTIDLAELVRAAHRYFEATVEVASRNVESRSEASTRPGDRVEILIRSEQHGYEGRLSIQSRRTSPHDLEDAREAEQRGRAAGMAALAERCPTLWEVESVGEDNELARLNLCGILASVALGPVLPDDGATLYGVRGAMERVDRLLKAR